MTRPLRTRAGFVAVRVGVVREHRHRDLAAGAHDDGVLDRVRGLVRRLGGSDADPDRRGALLAEAVAHAVGEGVHTRRVVERLVDEVVRAGLDDAALGGRASDADELDRVAVGIDAVERDRDAHFGAAQRARREVARARGGVRLEVDRQHLDRDVAGVLLPGAVDGLVGGVDGLRLGAGAEAERVLRHEELAVGGIDERRDQIGGDVDRVAVGVVVVLEHRDRHDVARAHDDLVVVGDGRAQLRGRGHGDDDDLAVGGLRAVGDAVRDAHLAIEGGLVADPEGLVAEDRDGDAGARLDRDRLHDEDAARRDRCRSRAR